MTPMLTKCQFRIIQISLNEITGIKKVLKPFVINPGLKINKK